VHPSLVWERHLRAAAASFDHEGAPCTDPLAAPALERHGYRYIAGCEAHPEDVPGRLREGRVWQGLGASGLAAHVRLAAVR
jgi:hypothetical protein